VKINRIAFLFILISFAGLVSCKKPRQFLGGSNYHVLVKLLNMKYYGDRSEETVNDFLKKRHYHYDYSFLAIDSLYDLHKEPKYNNIIIPENIPLDSMNWSLIQVRIFNPDGSFYNSLAQCSGDFGDEKYTFDFPIIKNECSFKNEKLELKNEFDLMHINSNTSSQILNEAKKYKYILFVYWNIQSNYFSERILRSVSKLKRKHPNEVMVILVNHDSGEKKSNFYDL
jgi:hypothetical protein